MARHPEISPRVARWQRLGLWTLVATSVTTATFLVHHVTNLQEHFAHIESARLEEELELREDLFELKHVMGILSGRLETSTAELANATELNERLGRTEQTLGSIGERIAAQAGDLERMEAAYEGFAPELERELSRRDEEIDERIEDRWQSLSTLVASVKEAATANMTEMERLEQNLQKQRDLDAMWNDLVGPVVQLAGELSVGSGVLLPSERDEAAGTFRTHLITAWHVVRDIQGDLDHTDLPVPVFIYAKDGDVRREEASLLAFDPNIDVALLAIETPRALEHGARLAPPSRLAQVRIFDPVYAVGCPLGNDPIPTHGEIATVAHRVDDETYWMINAPTYIGNSGGGIFDSEHHELLGIFSKIYTHGSLRPTIIPHMGLVTPLTVVYDWLRREGFASVIPSDEGPEHRGRLASASVPR